MYKTKPQLFKYLELLYYSLLMLLSLFIILIIFYFMLSNLDIRNELVHNMIDSFNPRIFYNNFSAIYFPFFILYLVIKAYEKLSNLEVFPNLKYFKYLNVILTFSLGTSLFISMETNDGDLSQIILTLFLTIFPYSILKEIFNDNFEEKIDSSETAEKWQKTLNENKKP